MDNPNDLSPAEFYARGCYKFIVKSPSKEEHIKHIEKNLEFLSKCDGVDMLTLLVILKQLYNESLILSFLYSNNNNKDIRKFLVEDVTKWIDERINEERRKQEIIQSLPPSKPSPKTLLSIWNPKKEELYKKYIDYLKEQHINLGSPFIKEDHDGNLEWIKTPSKGWVQYLIAFFHICNENEMISPLYTTTEYLEVIQNTFNVKPNKKPFTNLITKTTPEDKYLIPFKTLKQIK